MRLFLGIELDRALRAAAAKAAADLGTRLHGARSVKWVAMENMHVTVRFIGHVDDARVPQLLDVLAPSLPIDPFELTLGEFGVFPAHGAPRVLWIGIRDGGASLQAMSDRFNRRLVLLGFEAEARPFNAHVTLARIKDAPRGLGARLRQTMDDIHVTPTRSHVVEATLFESRPSPKGSTYIARLRIPLRAEP